MHLAMLRHLPPLHATLLFSARFSSKGTAVLNIRGLEWETEFRADGRSPFVLAAILDACHMTRRCSIGVCFRLESVNKRPSIGLEHSKCLFTVCVFLPGHFQLLFLGLGGMLSWLCGRFQTETWQKEGLHLSELNIVLVDTSGLLPAVSTRS